ncbi:ABC transporter permease [Microvirga sp. G4-2]|uniref:ABC transporter permease n=1 Tax=Microvirga sp. G4-2 TaxID=3434467 RepID=UPI004044F322
MDIFTASLFSSALLAATPLLWAAMGGLVSHQAGLFNFTLEALMLFGAFFSVLFTIYTDNVVLGILLGALTVVMLSLLWGWAVIDLKADHIISALGFLLLAQGGTAFLMIVLLGQSGGIFVPQQLEFIELQWLEALPAVGPVLNNQTGLTYLALLSLPLMLFVLYRTSFGLAIRSVGERPEAAAAAGISVRAVRYIAVAITGLFCALGGAQLSLGYLAMFTENMTAGRGIIAFAAVIFGRHLPLPVFSIALFFGFAGALTDRLQGFGIPSELILTLPYVLTVVALGLASARFFRRLTDRSSYA